MSLIFGKDDKEKGGDPISGKASPEKPKSMASIFGGEKEEGEEEESSESPSKVSPGEANFLDEESRCSQCEYFSDNDCSKVEVNFSLYDPSETSCRLFEKSGEGEKAEAKPAPVKGEESFQGKSSSPKSSMADIFGA
jgi:hypothetical protein